MGVLPMTHPAAPGDERWIQPGGLPSDDYFVAVTNAIAGRGIAVASTRRPYGWEFELMLALAASARDRLEIGLRDGVVSERCRSWSWCRRPSWPPQPRSHQLALVLT
jgi:hypothetical protein